MTGQNFLKEFLLNPIFKYFKLSLKYQKFIASCCKDIGIRKSEFVEKAQMFGNPPIKAVNFVKLVIAIILECTKKKLAVCYD